MKEIRNIVIAVVVIVVAANVLTGHGADVALFVTDLATELTKYLGKVMIAVALPVLLLGGLLYVSPWSRDLAIRLMTGAVVVLAIAVLGPLLLPWLHDQLTTYGARLFGVKP